MKTETTMQAELAALTEHLNARGLDATEVASLGAVLVGHAIRRLRATGQIDDAAAEGLMQSAFDQMRRMAFPNGDRRN